MKGNKMITNAATQRILDEDYEELAGTAQDTYRDPYAYARFELRWSLGDFNDD